MEQEGRQMQELLDSYLHKMPPGLAGASSLELQKRVAVLYRGFQYRIRSLLESEFLRFRRVLTEEKWHLLGRTFTLERAARVSSLAEIPSAYFQFVQEYELTAGEISALQQDFSILLCQRAEFLEPMTTLHLAQIQEETILRLQPTVQLSLRGEEFWVISRNRLRFFERQVDSVVMEILQLLKTIPLPVGEALDILPSEREFTQFLVSATQDSWFAI